MNSRHSILKRTAAIIGLIIIAAFIILMLYGLLTQNNGLIMASIFCLIVIPALIYLFMLVLRISRR